MAPSRTYHGSIQDPTVCARPVSLSLSVRRDGAGLAVPAIANVYLSYPEVVGAAAAAQDPVRGPLRRIPFSLSL